MFIGREFDRTEHDDFILNVQPYIGKYEGAIKIYDNGGNLTGWKITDTYK